MSDMTTALGLVERLRSWTPRSAGDDAHVDGVEVVALDGEVGLELRWTQAASTDSPRRFRLVMTVRELLDRGYGGVDPVDLAAGDLALAVEEPHAQTHPGVREVFRRIP